MKRCFIFLSLFFLLSSSLKAEPTSWMRKVDSEKLGLYVFTDPKCPFSTEDIKNGIEGEYLRARINSSNISKLLIETSIQCMVNTSKSGVNLGYTISYSVSFGTFMKGEMLMYRFPQYGGMLAGSDDARGYKFFVDTIVSSNADAITDYLKANLAD